MIKEIVTILIAIMFMSMTASAYVPPEYRTSEHMSELEIVKVALAASDAGDTSRWVTYTLDDATEELTNAWHTRNNYKALREWVTKVERQNQPVKYSWIEPVNDIWNGPGSN